MKRWIGWGLLVLGLVIACLFRTETMKENDKPWSELRLPHSKALIVTYTVKGAKKSMTVDGESLRDVLGTLHIEEGYKGKQASLYPLGTLRFVIEPDAEREAMLVSDSELDVSNWGLLRISPSFFRKVCELAGAQEGRPINVMENNP